MSSSKRIIVSGKVQGVWYRKYTHDKASQLGLKGTVQNLENGDVMIEAVGTEEQLNELEEWCWHGSPQSAVTNVISQNREHVDYPDFRIKE